MTQVNVTYDAEEVAKEMRDFLRTQNAKDKFKADVTKIINDLELGQRPGRNYESPGNGTAKEVLFYDRKALLRYDQPREGDDFVEIFDFIWCRNNR